MDELQDLQTVMDAVLKLQREQGYAQNTLKLHQIAYHGLLKFMRANNYTTLNEDVGLEYVRYRTGTTMEGFYGSGDRKTNVYMKPVQNLLVYMKTGSLSYYMRPKISEFQCPEGFEEEYLLFQDAYEERHYANATIISNNQILHKFLDFLDGENITESSGITLSHVTKFLGYYSTAKPKYVATILYVMRNYLSFLYQQSFTKEDLSKSLPKVRIMRNAFIAYSWNTQDVKKLLSAVDRADPKGKRDYAILLMVVRLGLRVSDIRGLKLSSLNWNRKTIILTMQKTKRPIELPLLDDIGWAIIDYLKNGRPQTPSDRVFVRHRAPFDAFGENESFWRDMHRYMVKAGLNIPLDVHCGMHSLRSTLARNMLEANAPLPVISEALGHQNINTTSIYLKIDIVGLRRCALDPDEVAL
ncbi:Tyrosine recombinase XerC [Sporomusa acidovorans DSM 3132]|uniref:Tyrosine recombinase XerC n=2 Tax=Sporomusa acidovorans (strain ATCC 49682 / DSM 3132 / Mol) TaxID=1123286 RepID=A0ABZ3JCF1_SPOA4